MRLLCCLLGGWLIGGIAATTQAETNSPTALRVMTFNLRYGTASDGTNVWPNRRPLMRELLTNATPDLIGTQEGLYQQLRELAQDLPDYQWTGVGRDDGKTKGEFMAIFYRPTRLEALSTNHFWLSGTPEVPGSTTWGNQIRRMVTWMEFRDRVTDQKFFFFNTHFDHIVQLSREKSAELLRQRVQELNTQLPVVVTGDFNAAAQRNQVYTLLTEDGFFSDTWLVAKERVNDGVNTFNNYQPPVWKGNRIDWILTRGPVKVLRGEILTAHQENRFPSDHFPVMVWLTL